VNKIKERRKVKNINYEMEEKEMFLNSEDENGRRQAPNGLSGYFKAARSRTTNIEIISYLWAIISGCIGLFFNVFPYVEMLIRSDFPYIQAILSCDWVTLVFRVFAGAIMFFAIYIVGAHIVIFKFRPPKPMVTLNPENDAYLHPEVFLEEIEPRFFLNYSLVTALFIAACLFRVPTCVALPKHQISTSEKDDDDNTSFWSQLNSTPWLCCGSQSPSIQWISYESSYRFTMYALLCGLPALAYIIFYCDHDTKRASSWRVGGRAL